MLSLNRFASVSLSRIPPDKVSFGCTQCLGDILYNNVPGGKEGSLRQHNFECKNSIRSCMAHSEPHWAAGCGPQSICINVAIHNECIIEIRHSQKTFKIIMAQTIGGYKFLPRRKFPGSSTLLPPRSSCDLNTDWIDKICASEEAGSPNWYIQHKTKSRKKKKDTACVKSFPGFWDTIGHLVVIRSTHQVRIIKSTEDSRCNQRR